MTVRRGPAQCRCRFPGCESRRIDLHHIVYWSHGGRTDLDNLISLCKSPQHDCGPKPDGTFVFYRPDGTALPPSPPLPKPAGHRGLPRRRDHRETIIPPWYGERLDLDHAIYVCLANARTPQERREQAEDPARDASRSSNRTAGPTGYASTTTSTPPQTAAPELVRPSRRARPAARAPAPLR